MSEVSPDCCFPALFATRRVSRTASSLFRLLAQRRGKSKRQIKRPLTEEQILAWADAYYARQARWPTLESGMVAEEAGLTWGAVHGALLQGHRSLPSGSSLAKLLDRCRRNGAATIGYAVGKTAARSGSTARNRRLVKRRPK